MKRSWPVSEDPELESDELREFKNTLSSEELFDLRNCVFSFDALDLAEPPTYFNRYSNEAQPENLHRVGILDLQPRATAWGWRRKFIEQVIFSSGPEGTTCFLVNDKPTKLKENLQTKEARESRIRDFQSLADNVFGNHASSNNDGGPQAPSLIEFLAEKTEEYRIIKWMDITEISGLPHRSTWSGKIDAAIVLPLHTDASSIPVPKLVIVASEGTKCLDVREHFSMQRPEMSGLCALCCPPACLSACCPCCTSADFNMNYNIGQLYQAQHIEIPITTRALVDVHTYRNVNRSLKAQSGKVASQCQCYCFNCLNCFLCCRDVCCAVCACQCCKCEIKKYENDFSASAEHQMDQPRPQEISSRRESDKILWDMSLSGADETVVMVHYRTLESNKLQKIRMVLPPSPRAFKIASEFVAALGTMRVWEGVPPVLHNESGQIGDTNVYPFHHETEGTTNDISWANRHDQQSASKGIMMMVTAHSEAEEAKISDVRSSTENVETMQLQSETDMKTPNLIAETVAVYLGPKNAQSEQLAPAAISQDHDQEHEDTGDDSDRLQKFESERMDASLHSDSLDMGASLGSDSIPLRDGLQPPELNGGDSAFNVLYDSDDDDGEKAVALQAVDAEGTTQGNVEHHGGGDDGLYNLVDSDSEG